MVIGDDDGHRPLRFPVWSHVSQGTPTRAALTNRIADRAVGTGRVDVLSTALITSRHCGRGVNPPFDIDWRNQRLRSPRARLGDKSAATIKKAPDPARWDRRHDLGELL